VNIGDRLDSRRVDEALRALYATGFFRDVEIRRDGGTLVVAVLERPSIESFTITGNKDIKTEDLEKSLRNVGLSRGKTFNQSTLDEVERFLTDQYFSRGKYAVQVDTKVEEVAGNRVKIAVDIPLAVKLSPYYSAMSKFAALAVDAGADGLVLFNRFYAPDLDLERLSLLARADLSEPDDQRIALRWLGILRGQLPEVGLACTSGVHSGSEIIKALLVGADVACTASAILRRGPEAVAVMLAEAERWMTAHEYTGVAQLRGSMSAASVEDSSAYERAQYQAVLHSGRYA
jgi:hypothetical protein